MSIEQQKLFHFVSKLLFSTKRGEIEWHTQDLPSFMEELLNLQHAADEFPDYPLCYCYPTPDAKNLWFFVYPRSKYGWLELRNRESRLELTIDMHNYGSLSHLYQAICEKEEEGDLHSAEKTIDLILNVNKETATSGFPMGCKPPVSPNESFQN